MTKEEIVKLLSMMRAAYPNTKISDPSGTVAAWELAFGDESASAVYMAARYHMKHSPFFPTVADIVKSISRGQLVYGGQVPETKAIEPPRVDLRERLCPGSAVCPYFEGELCFGTKEEWEACYL